MTKIIILNEKGADRYFVYHTAEELNVIFLGILRERFNDGYYYPTAESAQRDLDSQIKQIDDRYSDLTLEEIESLPERLRAENRMKHDKALKLRRTARDIYEEELEFVKYLKILLEMNEDEAATWKSKSVRNGRVYVASALMADRSNHQYEGYNFEKAENE